VQWVVYSKRAGVKEANGEHDVCAGVFVPAQLRSPGSLSHISLPDALLVDDAGRRPNAQTLLA
jgi:hypothetical protein